MADRRDPPPLFDDDDLRKDDNDDLFSSAVQSPVNGQVAPELTTATTRLSSTAMSNTAAQSVSDYSNVATTPVSPSDTSFLLPVHPLSDPLQADFSGLSDSTSTNTNTPAIDSFSNTSDSGLCGVLNPANISLPNTLEIAISSSIANTSDSCFVSSLPASRYCAPESSSSDGAAFLTDVDLDQPISLESDNSFLRSNFEPNSSDGNGIGSIGQVMTSTSISNLPPVPSNMYNIANMAGVEDSPSSMDLFESCVEDAIVRPFATISLSEHQELNTSGAVGFEEPVSDEALHGILGGCNPVTSTVPAVGVVSALPANCISEAQIIRLDATEIIVDVHETPVNEVEYGASFPNFTFEQTGLDKGSQDQNLPDKESERKNCNSAGLDNTQDIHASGDFVDDSASVTDLNDKLEPNRDNLSIFSKGIFTTVQSARDSTVTTDGHNLLPVQLEEQSTEERLDRGRHIELIDISSVMFEAQELIDFPFSAPDATEDDAISGLQAAQDMNSDIPVLAPKNDVRYKKGNSKIPDEMPALNVAAEELVALKLTENEDATHIGTFETSAVVETGKFKESVVDLPQTEVHPSAVEPLVKVGFEMAKAMGSDSNMSVEAVVDSKELDKMIHHNGSEKADVGGDVSDDEPLFAKMKKPRIAVVDTPRFFLTEDETSEVPLDGPCVPKQLDVAMEVSLDADDDGLFSGGVLDNAQMKPQLDNASILSPATTLPTMGAPLTPPSDLPTLPVTTSYSGTADATNANTIVTPPLPTAGAGVQPCGLYSPVQPPLASLTKLPTGNSNDDEFIEILISEPQKVGDGMGSYMAYKITTRTNITFFKKQCWSVTRRFSDFLGLHGKLVEKHLHTGRIIPPAPEKEAFNTTKLRLSSTDGFSDSARIAEFLQRRRAALQRYMQRTAALPHLRADPDFREFVELDTELPRATQTSAMSGAGVMRLFNRVGETVNKITFKMEESDQWFEDRVHQMESLECELRRLHTALEGLATGRRELAVCSGSVGKAAAVLSSVEEHSALSRALHQLAEAAERTHTVYHAQTDADFYILCETTRDYINLIGAVKEVFHERVKVFQAWQYSQTMLAKKRDLKAKLELTARQDKVVLAQQEVQEWEGKVERNQEHFERISLAIKKELEQFDVVRVQDFKNMLIRYLEAMVTSQQQVIKVWESFLPEARAIS